MRSQFYFLPITLLLLTWSDISLGANLTLEYGSSSNFIRNPTPVAAQFYRLNAQHDKIFDFNDSAGAMGIDFNYLDYNNKTYSDNARKAYIGTRAGYYKWLHEMVIFSELTLSYIEGRELHYNSTVTSGLRGASFVYTPTIGVRFNNDLLAFELGYQELYRDSLAKTFDEKLSLFEDDMKVDKLSLNFDVFLSHFQISPILTRSRTFYRKRSARFSNGETAQFINPDLDKFTDTVEVKLTQEFDFFTYTLAGYYEKDDDKIFGAEDAELEGLKGDFKLKLGENLIVLSHNQSSKEFPRFNAFYQTGGSDLRHDESSLTALAIQKKIKKILFELNTSSENMKSNYQIVKFKENKFSAKIKFEF